MSLGIALNNAVSGLRVNQQSLAVLSQNLANVNTAGYTRKVVDQSAIYIAGSGQGVTIDAITRKVDTYLQRSTLSQGSEAQRTGIISNYYDRVQVLLGQPGASNSLDEYMTTFFNTLQQMAEQPDRTSYRSNFVNAADQLATQISTLASELESLRFQADNDLGEAVGTVNSALDRLYTLNDAIAQAYGARQSTAGLLDERDKLMKIVADQLDVTVTFAENGTVSLTAANGVSLLDPTRHKLQYSPSTAIGQLVGNYRLSDINAIAIDEDGKQLGVPSILVTGGKLGETVSGLRTGKMQGLVEMRDDLLPAILAQLDGLANNLRDTMNAIHNNGSGYPGASSLTGTRLVDATQPSEWTGSMRIAVLNADGSPASTVYNDESFTGVRPLTIDFSLLNDGSTDGHVTVNTIIQEINNYFGPGGAKAHVGGLNNIQLVSNVTQLPSGAPSLFTFDLDIDNITDGDNNIFISNITVLDDTATDITSVTQDVPSIALATTGTYTTTTGLSTVDVTLSDIGDLRPGDVVYLGAPGTPTVNGIPAANLTGYFTITAVAGNTITIDTGFAGGATGTGSVNDASGVIAKPKYDTIEAGTKERTRDQGQLQVDFGASTSDYFDITLDIAVVNEDGGLTTSQVTYRILNNQPALLNDRYDATAVSGSGSLVLPTESQTLVRAIMVDENGLELQKLNGDYVSGRGYLKLITDDTTHTIAIDEGNSANAGNPSGLPPVAASYRAFSHYFELNNFFASNLTTETGDTVKNSAINLRVEQRIVDDPNLVSSGKLALQTQPPAGSDLPPQYTYVRYPGDNLAVQAMAALSSDPLVFAAAGGLPRSELSLQTYTSEMLGYLASLSAGATTTADNAQLLYDGFNSRSQAISNVNLDEELANTVIFQNNYAATARIVTVVDEMFKTLIESI